MRIQNILLASLFVSLYGCQPGTPEPKAAVEQPAPPVANGAAVPDQVKQTEPVSAEKAAQPIPGEKMTAEVKTKEAIPQPAVAKKPAQPSPSPAVDAPAAKAVPAPVIAEVKPEPSAPAVSEADALQLAKMNNCLSCHAIDRKVVGPAWKDVAAKYRGDAGAEARLMDKIAKGGKGVWGVMVMPPSPKISEADRKILAKFVLSLK